MAATGPGIPWSAVVRPGARARGRLAAGDGRDGSRTCWPRERAGRSGRTCEPLRLWEREALLGRAALLARAAKQPNRARGARQTLHRPHLDAGGHRRWPRRGPAVPDHRAGPADACRSGNRGPRRSDPSRCAAWSTGPWTAWWLSSTSTWRPPPGPPGARRPASRRMLASAYGDACRRMPAAACMNWPNAWIPPPPSTTLVLPGEQRECSGDILAHRGTGPGSTAKCRCPARRARARLHALVSSSTGTGKTKNWPPRCWRSAMDLDLYRVDLSQVVSKYIGEPRRTSAASSRRPARLPRAAVRRGGRPRLRQAQRGLG